MLLLYFLCHPAGAEITNIKADLQKSGVAGRQSSRVSVGRIRRDVQGCLEEGEHFKKPLGSHLGRRLRNPLDFSTGQKQTEEQNTQQGSTTQQKELSEAKMLLGNSSLPFKEDT